jgi:hypothetical protein
MAIAKTKHRRFATLAAPILAILAWCLPMAPAIIINVDWSGRTPIGWSLAAIVGIILAAVFVEASRHVRQWYIRLLLIGLTILGMHVNMLVAMKTASVASDDDRNARETRILAASRASSQSSQSSHRRDALVAIAGETPSATYEAQIQEATNRDIRKWESTAHCTDVTAKASGTYCAEIASLQGKKKAAEDREKLDAERPLAPIAEAAPSEDLFADNIATFAGVFGLAIRKEMVTPYLNVVRALWLEVMAAFGPMAILALLFKTEPQLPKAQTPEPAEPMPAEPTLDEDVQKLERKEERQRLHDIFVADSLETHSGAFMMTAEPWKLWQAFCTARDAAPGDRRSFTQRLGKNFPHDPNNGRPRFLNVRAKQNAPTVRLAVSN